MSIACIKSLMTIKDSYCLGTVKMHLFSFSALSNSKLISFLYTSVAFFSVCCSSLHTGCSPVKANFHDMFIITIRIAQLL